MYDYAKYNGRVLQTLGRLKSSTAKDRNMVDKNCLLHTQYSFSISVCQPSAWKRDLVIANHESSVFPLRLETTMVNEAGKTAIKSNRRDPSHLSKRSPVQSRLSNLVTRFFRAATLSFRTLFREPVKTPHRACTLEIPVKLKLVQIRSRLSTVSVT